MKRTALAIPLEELPETARLALGLPGVTPARRPAKAPEFEFQCQFVRELRRDHPGLLFYAVPNGGKRGKVAAVKAKLEGALAGVPDLVFPEPRYPFHGLYLELKAPRKGSWSAEGQRSQHQREVQEQLERRGYLVANAGHIEAARALVESYLALEPWAEGPHAEAREAARRILLAR